MRRLEQEQTTERFAGRSNVLILPSPLVAESNPARAVAEGLNSEGFKEYFKARTATPGDKGKGYSSYDRPINREAVERIWPVVIIEDPLKGRRAYDLVRILPKPGSKYSPIVLGTFVTPLSQLREPIGISHAVGEAMRRARFPRHMRAGFALTAMERLDARVVFDQETYDMCKSYYESLKFEYIPLSEGVEQATAKLAVLVSSLQEKRRNS